MKLASRTSQFSSSSPCFKACFTLYYALPPARDFSQMREFSSA